MSPSALGRFVLGASSVLFGAIALAWHDRETWQTMHLLWNLPFGSVVGATLMVAQILGGIAILFPRGIRTGSIVLAILYAIFALTCAVGIGIAPRAIGSYDSTFEQVAILCGALALLEVRAAAARAMLRRSVRIGLGLSAVSFALTQYVYLHETASLVPAWVPPNHVFWAILTTAAFALAAIAMLLDRKARLAAHLMSLMIALFGLVVWVPILVAHPQSHFSWSEFALTMLIAGASAAAADTFA